MNLFVWILGGLGCASDPCAREGCDDELGGDRGDGESDTDADTDSDSDTDTDADADADADTDVDTDTGTPERYTVRPDGTAPFLTVQTAVDTLESGAVITLCPARYAENVVIPRSVTLQGSDPATTVLDGGGLGTVVQAGESLTLRGLTLTGGSGGVAAVDASPAVLDLTIDGCVIADNRAEGAAVAWTGSIGTLTLRDTSFERNTSTAWTLVYSTDGDVHLERVTFRGNTVGDYGSLVDVSARDDHTFDIWNSAFLDNDVFTLVTNAAVGVEVYNSALEAPGVALTARGPARVRNSIFRLPEGAEPTSDSYAVEASGYSADVAYSDFYGHTYSWHANGAWHAAEENDGFSADPLFVDRAGGDLRLDAGSPCVDAGDPSAKADDGDGTRNDLGVFGGPSGAW